jgi:hypothetical protein
MFFPTHSTTKLSIYSRIPLSTLSKWKQKWAGKTPDKDWRGQMYDKLAMDMVVQESTNKFFLKKWSKKEIDICKEIVKECKDEYFFVCPTSRKALYEKIKARKDEEDEDRKKMVSQIMNMSPSDKLALVRFTQAEHQ